MTRQRVLPARRSAGGSQIAFVLSLFLLFLFIAGGIGYGFYQQVRAWVASSDTLPSLSQPAEGGGLDWMPGQPLPTWEGTARVTVLVLGVDERESEEGPWRTDTMILLTIDPLTRSGAMLSIPRDLWVPIPGYGEGRINTANYLGDAYDYPGGGPALAMQTVEYNLGVQVDYYARVNFRAFIEMVDLIGGVDICVEEAIDDPEYPSSDPADPYGVEHLVIPAGCQHMDGTLALKYARTRHGSSDFERARRQQQVLMAIMDRVTRLDLLPQLASRAPQMWQTLNESVQTDLTLDQIVRLANLATQVPRENIRTGVIDASYVEMWTTPDGQQVLVPVRDRIRELRDYLFTSAPQAAGTEDPALRLAAEAARVEVLNGTVTPGLAQTTAQYLQAQGITVTAFGNADHSGYDRSLIIVYTDKPFTAETIARLLNLPPTAVTPMSQQTGGPDIVVILGSDYQPPAP